MRNLKKVMAFAVVLTMIATLFVAMPIASAEADYSTSVQRLVGLGLLQGYDGQLHENAPITRAQFAAIVVRARGLETAAQASGYETKFSDVPAGHWAAGYVNVANQMGIINGKGDGTFGGDEQVSFKDAVTMVVRALGYEPMAKTKGGYPVGYLVVASEKEITKDINVNVNDAAARGLVAKVVDNSLQIPFMEQTGYSSDGTVQYGVPEKDVDQTTIMKSLKFESADRFVIETAAVNADLDADEIVLDVAVDSKTKFDIKDTVDADALLGKKVKLWFNKDNDVVLAEVKTKEEETVKVKEIKEITYNADSEVTKIKVKDSNDKEKTYEVFADANVVWNLGVSDLDTLLNEVVARGTDETKSTMTLKKEAYDITLTLAKDKDDDDELKVKFATGLTFDNPFKLASDPVINSVNDLVRIKIGMVLQSDEDTKVEKYVIVKDGEEVDVEDIEKNDVLFVAKNPGSDAGIEDDRYYIIATSDTVTGELELVKGTMDAATKVTVDGTEYSFSAFATASDKDIDAVGIAIEDTVKLTLDKDGKILAIDLEETNSADTYAVVANAGKETSSKYGTSTTYYVKLFTTEGEKIEYKAVDDAKALLKGLDDGTTTDISDIKGQLVKYHINADGEVDNIETTTGKGGVSTSVNGDLDKIGAYPVKDSMVVFNITEVKTDGSDYKIEVLDWDSVTGQKTANLDYISLKDGELEAVVFNDASFASDANYALVATKYAIKDAYRLDMFTKAGEDTLDTTGRDVYADAGQVIDYELNAKGKVSDVTVMSAKATVDSDGDAYYAIDEVRSSRIKVGANWYYFADDMKVYYDEKEDGDKVTEYSKDDLYKDMEVKLYTDTIDGVEQVVVVVITKM